MLAGQLAGLGVVDEEQVDPLQGAEQALPLGVDPEVHGVARHEPGCPHLVEHRVLQVRVDVAEEDEVGVAPGGREHRLEGGQHVELGVEGVRGVEVELVAPLPAEGLAGLPRQPGQVGPAGGEEPHVLLGEVLSDHRHHPGRPEEARAGREVGSRSPQDLLPVAEGRLQRVERDGPDDQQRHVLLSGAAVAGARMGLSSPGSRDRSTTRFPRRGRRLGGDLPESRRPPAARRRRRCHCRGSCE